MTAGFMTAMHLSRTHAPCRNHRVWVGLLLIAAGSLAGAAEPPQPATTPAATAGQAPTITAVHKARELSFNYRNQGYHYSCHDLEKRVAVLLIAIGARDDISVSARNCDALMIASGDTSMDIDPTFGRGPNDPFGRDRADPFGRDRNDPWSRSGGYRRSNEREQSAQIHIKLMMPVEVTPQILEEIERDKSRRQLISRVTGNPAASMNDPIVFAARREEVTLSQRTLRLQPEDCDLLQQLTTQVIRKLDVKIKHQSFGCGPRSRSRIAPQLTVETWLPTGTLLPMPDPEKMKTPGASGAASPPGEANEPETQPAGSEPHQQ